MGAMNGAFATVPAPNLGAACIKALLERTNVAGASIDEVIMGNVIGAGLGQNPARQSAIYAGLPDSVGAVTVNKVCGSGLKAVMLADLAIRAGDASLIVAGGMENMTRAPYLLTRAREGYRLGHGELLDSMIVDGLWDVYGMKHMGTCGELCALKYGYSRQEQDDFAVRSHNRARQAIAAGVFESEIVPFEISTKGKQAHVVAQDEGPAKYDEAKLRLSSRHSAPTARSPRETLPVSATGPPRSSWPLRNGAARRSSGRLPRSKVPPPGASSPIGSPPHPSGQSGSCSKNSRGRSSRSTCSRSTRLLPS